MSRMHAHSIMMWTQLPPIMISTWKCTARRKKVQRNRCDDLVAISTFSKKGKCAGEGEQESPAVMLAQERGPLGSAVSLPENVEIYSMKKVYTTNHPEHYKRKLRSSWNICRRAWTLPRSHLEQFTASGVNGVLCTARPRIQTTTTGESSIADCNSICERSSVIE